MVFSSIYSQRFSTAFTAILTSLMLVLSSCAKTSDLNSIASAVGGTAATSTTTATSGGGGGSGKYMRIIETGTTGTINSVSINIADTISLRAALFDSSGVYIQDVAANWSMSGASFSSNNLVPAGDDKTATFTPTINGATIISASYYGTDITVLAGTDSTGLIVVSGSQVVDSVTIYSGNAQTGLISTNLSSPLIVRVLDVYSQPISLASIAWSVTGGAGTIISSTPSATDSSGLASATVSLGSSVGTSNNTYRATSVAVPAKTANFSASGIGGVTNPKYLKIIAGAESSGTGAEISTVALNVLDPQLLRAALFDQSGTYVSDIAATWSMSGGSFPSGNLVIGGTTKSATFTPSTIGTTVVTASYNGADTDVVSTVDTTGTITVTAPQVETSMLKIAGDTQSGTVNNNLATQLKVQILDAYSQPIAGKQVSWSVTQGSGSIIGTNPATTDASGYAVATVKLGTAAGGNNNQYRATSVDTPSLTADFSETATAGSQDHLTFTTEPAVMYAGMAFLVQPVVKLYDVYNNLVSASGTITLTKQAGTGTLGGTLTATMTDGIATFTNVSFSAAGAGLVIRASNGTVTGDTSSLTVGAAPPGACATNDAAFTTSSGGCMDIITGLTWSKGTTGLAYSWFQAVWDVTFAGAAAADSDDFGRSNDYDETYVYACKNNKATRADECDNSNASYYAGSQNVGSYCKSLNEGGYTDWRVPTRADYTLSMANGLYTHMNNPVAATNYWTSSTEVSDGLNTYTAILSTGVIGAQRPNTTQNVVCVRGNRSTTAPTKITVISGPTSVGLNLTVATPLVVNIQDASGNNRSLGGITLALSTNLGTLGGTTTAVTDTNGKATFSAFSLNTTGSATVTVSYGGVNALYTSLTPATRAINVGAFKHTCAAEDIYFTTALGGCRDLTSGLVWAFPNTALKTWFEVVWDQSLAGAGAMDADDYGRGNDYSEIANEATYGSYNIPDVGTPIGGTPATNAYSASVSPLDVCHSLNEGGYTDWRVPTKNELAVAYQNGAFTHFAGLPTTAINYWTGSSYSSGTQEIYAWLVNSSTGTVSVSAGKNTAVASSICVRGGTRNLPTKLVGVSGPTVISVGSVPATALKVRIQDASSNNINAGGRTVTIASTSVGTLGGTLTATTDAHGVASFSAFTLNTAGDAIVLTLTTPGLTNITYTLNARVGIGTQICTAENSRWKAQYGGCHDTVSLLVWSARSSANLSWHSAIWGSELSGNVAADGNDGGRTNDYVGGTVPGTPDNSTVNYCHDLVEGGYSDWRMPTLTEAVNANNASAATYLTGMSGQYILSSNTDTTTTNASSVMTGTGVLYQYPKSTTFPIFCVRAQ